MNYLILNGLKSTFLQGLLISSLPPISKPLMRTQRDEIDGRDGDIVTKLGYSAYDKTVTIGLHGNFDIDAILAYFEGEGEVIFSNEPDKYYRYQILEQIDYERLIRFRTAEVTFHIQPFKYSAIDSAVDISQNPQRIINMGNTIARPKLTIYGAGYITLYINGYQTVTANVSDHITIDAEALEASKDGVLKNRDVTGNYDTIYLNSGVNTIGWSGNVSHIEIENYSRWI